MDDDVLFKVSETLAKPLATWASYRGALLNEPELVGTFILSFLALRCRFENDADGKVVDETEKKVRHSKRSWATGCIGKLPGNDLYFRKEAAVLDKSRQATRLTDIPGLVDLLLGNDKKLELKLLRLCEADHISDLTLSAVFRAVRLFSVPDFVNSIMCMWLDSSGCGVPFVLMHSIPAPMQVLRQQASGTRVITLLLEPQQLRTRHVSALAYMSGGVTHARDALDFLLHDVQHMHMFLQKDIYLEQVGFFHVMASLDHGKTFKYFTRDSNASEISSELWTQLQYCFSDMNCWVTHLIKYLKAKWLLHYSHDTISFDERWESLLLDIGMREDGGEAFDAARRICSDELSNAEGKAIRDFFAAVGLRCLHYQ